MFRNRVYYRIKPLIPRAIRMAVRRRVAMRKRQSIGNIWPILPGSERKPEGWPGWPDGKQFAVVLTHDVEGPEGLAKCLKLAKLEKELGFRSSFNFIPEGSYRVSKELRDQLTAEGFEVGIHDLEHDGKLFQNREDFLRKAERINRYVKEWDASGFRSGFMLHNLEWLHDLNVTYDASTFDTDPFEPQPEGRHTIFPFWVPRPQAGGRSTVDCGPLADNPSTVHRPPSTAHRSAGPVVPSSRSPVVPKDGYVELPYTLPQDSTLFLLLKEKTPEIWLRKVDWIAQNGGMVLVNVHPDYVRFDGEAPSADTYAVGHYTALLRHIRDRQSGSYWHAKAWEMARFVRDHKPCAPRKRRRIGMITYSHFVADARVKRYAEALAERGDQVDVLALRRSPAEPIRQRAGNIDLVALQLRLGKQEKTPLSFLWPVLRFLFSSAAWIARAHSRQPYDLLHIHNIPDFLVFAGAYPKLMGAKILLDIHDIVPEFYGSKFKVPSHSTTIRLLKFLERVSANFATHVIISNHLWHEKYVARTGTTQRCSVFINNVDSTTFFPRARTRTDGKVIILFPGGLQWHQGLDIAIRGFGQIASKVPNAEFHIYGDGNMKDALVALAQQLGLSERVRFFDPRPVNEIAEVMANADIGVVPKRADSFGNEAYSTKIMEFMSVGVPVVVSSTKIDRYYFNDSVVRFFESGNVDALAKAMLELIQDADARQELVTRASAYASAQSWGLRKKDYLALVDELTGERQAAQRRATPALVESEPQPSYQDA